ncbi:unnamed protein product [Euphydryas editha]|uniref:DUF4817 domain-containing protein n=1 Tax=Euphydryas editha TaxID=104508 RepID=A0AAU9U137_EUPED|nr:unnamed protein product [Euphydryas editha]
MKRYMLQQRVEIFKIYHQNLCSVRLAFRSWHPMNGIHGRHAESTVRLLMNKFQTTGSLLDETVLVCQRNTRLSENIVPIRASMREKPRQSIPRRAQQLCSTATV